MRCPICGNQATWFGFLAFCVCSAIIASLLRVLFS